MTALIRVKKEFPKCVCIAEYFVTLINDNIYKWKAVCKPNTDVFKKEYVFEITIPTNYPFSAPSVLCKSSIFHPNIDSNGKICSTLLTEWDPKYTIYTILTTILDLFREPNTENPVNLKAAELWSNKKAYTERLNMC